MAPNNKVKTAEHSDDSSQKLVKTLLSDTLPRLVDWLRTKIESHRIDFENDAPYLEGMLEDIEECVNADR